MDKKNFHSQDIKEVLRALESQEKGISQEEVKKRQETYGMNVLPTEKPLGKVKILFSQFNSALVYILLVAGTVSFILGANVDAGVIFGAVVINVIIGFWQENKANQALTKLKKLVEYKSVVIRNGMDMKVDSRLLVPGDVILVEAGNRILADARLIEAVDLQVNEAPLTGESLPSGKKTEPVPLGAALADRENMVYSGTIAVRGYGQAVITATGKQTEIGEIAELVKTTKEEKTPLQIRLMKFSRALGIIFGFISLIIITVGLVQGRGFLEMLETGVAVGVASIPEGLTVAVTFILALGMQQILRERALVRKLVATETLGSTTVICSDKTGTLTVGKMHVAHIVIGEHEYEIDTAGSRQDEKEASMVSLALQTAMMCNNAKIENPEEELKTWRFIGTPTEVALMSAAIQSGLNKEKLLEHEPMLAELPFDSERKFMISLHQKKPSGYVLYEKGAPEKLLAKSDKYFHHSKLCPITEKDQKKLASVYEKLTSRGLRVIGLGLRELKTTELGPDQIADNINWEAIDKNLTFLGFIAIKDPLRPEAAETIKISQEAGIRPIIITGDHKLTAQAIGNEVGLNTKEENILSGEDLDEISDDNLRQLVPKIDIYARVSPHHKLRIVQALRGRGEVVAMTGDGINDSPALKAADIGVSLGTGTDIAKETSDIVLLDNNFKTIVRAVEQGRVIFKNIRKVITYLISDSFSEMILIVGSILFSAPLAIMPAQILWINIVNDGLPDFSLAFERGDKKIMKQPPIKKNEPLINKEMKYIVFGAGIIRDLVVLALFYVLWQANTDIAYLRTLIFAILGVKSLMSIFSIRSLRRSIWQVDPMNNRYLLMAVSASFILLIFGIYWPPLQKILHTVNLDLAGWGLAMIIGLLSIVLIELVKLKFAHLARSKQQT